ncbi:CBS domain-containing protein [Roseovarius pacificus]|uniref:CBS domain-containing protein n=1 Tax=Roseovarius pacificus TaxID=337701 RepID=A0A1M6YVE9_9RHOB|nr:CBS domain-containing protein [Roseovarius pacificus]GGO50339.1 inosine-5-monophosphate dehydrogenase [Roseovarius pacificus]SHL22052.1 CBS domain-containing protein [Roseovarius pacificus]
MNVDRIMQTKITKVTSQTWVCAAAALMEAADIGLLPVCKDGRLVGVVTDRDIVLRLMSGSSVRADMPIGSIMSEPVVTCRQTDSIEHVAGVMGDHQFRRLIVLDNDGGLAGIVSVGDIARDASEIIAGEALGEIVEIR